MSYIGLDVVLNYFSHAFTHSVLIYWIISIFMSCRNRIYQTSVKHKQLNLNYFVLGIAFLFGYMAVWTNVLKVIFLERYSSIIDLKRTSTCISVVSSLDDRSDILGFFFFFSHVTMVCSTKKVLGILSLEITMWLVIFVKRQG